jgi:hypothetical protein
MDMRISWVMLASKSLLAWLAASTVFLAVRNLMLAPIRLVMEGRFQIRVTRRERRLGGRDLACRTEMAL